MSKYDASSIEVLTGLEPVQKRPGMYTDTTRPNHLAQEVIDNSVDEAIAGHASKIDVVLYKDGSLSVSDDGRGMPVDVHPEEGIPGVEVRFVDDERWRIILIGPKTSVARRPACHPPNPVTHRHGHAEEAGGIGDKMDQVFPARGPRPAGDAAHSTWNAPSVYGCVHVSIPSFSTAAISNSWATQTKTMQHSNSTTSRSLIDAPPRSHQGEHGQE